MKLIVLRILSYLIEFPHRVKPYPPGEESGALMLQEAARSLAPSGGESTQSKWLANVMLLRDQLASGRDPRTFLRWRVVLDTMFVAFTPYLWYELSYLRGHRDWHLRWEKLLEENSVGCPLPYLFYPRSSGNRIHHAYHLIRFEDCALIHVEDLGYVFEFGGGYGSLCRLIIAKGFAGQYAIFDLPLFSALQRYYLEANGVSVIPSTGTGDGQVHLVSDTNLLAKILQGRQRGNDLFVATWSLSESPLSLREQILPLLKGFQYLLIAYQERFEEIENRSFFMNFADQHGYDAISHGEISHLPGNYYLFARKKAAG